MGANFLKKLEKFPNSVEKGNKFDEGNKLFQLTDFAVKIKD